ncbi:PTS sugar transporter subunit IIC [Erysipelothrix inopinata]|uniref:Permease IIC component n=1 Tax=Erysipelothrix inopinata TaxID=225084 RepID=A0A7G9RY30_9FIRM|nr:PTS transporter subunit EIIC [Erysipelothrix inopinata]QNN60505.1 PTS sugar transporter subunit IIC [Erysipelothrix inopinata]
MKWFIDWVTIKLSPLMNRLSENYWIQGLYKAKLRTLPMIFVGSVISVYMVVYAHVPWLLDLSDIRLYTYGLISLFMVYMIPYYTLMLKDDSRHKYIAGCTGISIYMILVNPIVTEMGHVYQFSNFGAGGMFVAIIAGTFTAKIFILFEKFTITKYFKNFPETLVDGTDSVLPILVAVFTAWFIVIFLEFDLYKYMVNMLMPLQSIAQTFFGFVILSFLPVVFYSMGISNWVMAPIVNPVFNGAILMNTLAGAQNIFTNETWIAYINLGGKGATLGLTLLLLFSKSKSLKTLGMASIVPSVLNISEPVSFGIVIWNPTLMIPMWINGLVLPIITYLFVKIGIAPAPTTAFSMWYMPIGISAWMMTQSLGALLLVVVNLGISMMIWYPFVKSIEKKGELKREQRKMDEIKPIESMS